MATLAVIFALAAAVSAVAGAAALSNDPHQWRRSRRGRTDD